MQPCLPMHVCICMPLHACVPSPVCVLSSWRARLPQLTGKATPARLEQTWEAAGPGRDGHISEHRILLALPRSPQPLAGLHHLRQHNGAALQEQLRQALALTLALTECSGGRQHTAGRAQEMSHTCSPSTPTENRACTRPSHLPPEAGLQRERLPGSWVAQQGGVPLGKGAAAPLVQHSDHGQQEAAAPLQQGLAMLQQGAREKSARASGVFHQPFAPCGPYSPGG